MPATKILKLVGIAVLCLTLAGCKSAEERAEEHYQAALTLVAEGDSDRAIVELRNVFELNGFHQEARRMLAELFRKDGITQQAYGQYLRLAEQYPDDAEARVALAQMAFDARNWAELERHGAVAAEFLPDDPRVVILTMARDYRTAAEAKDTAALARLAAQAEALMKDNPDSPILRNLLIDSYVRNDKLSSALDLLDGLIAAEPGNRAYQDQRLNLLARLGDGDAIETQLRDMVAAFPEDNNLKATLIRFFLGTGNTDKAEAFLREIADPAAAEPGPFIDLIRFLAEVRGPEAARAEIERGIEMNPNPALFRALRAGFDFTAGERDKAVAELEDVLKTAEPSDQTRGIKVSLAQMLLSMGNEVGARRLIEEVLTEDGSNVDALRIRAAWQIAADDTDGAISSLRTALDKAPEDAMSMTLMAEAYTRAGNRDLANDFLALAVEASGNAPAETIRYARVLIEQERYLPAEDILLPALRLANNNTDLLSTLGQLYLKMEDVPRARQVIDTLRRIGTPQAVAVANGLEAEQLNQTSGSDEALAFLEGLANSDDADLNARLVLLRARLMSGDTAAALSLAEDLASADPENPQLQYALAASKSANGDLAGAVEIYRALLAKDQTQTPIWLELSRNLVRMGQRNEARAEIAKAVELMPEDPNILWAHASFLEQDQDIDGAIAIFEKLYEKSSGAVIVANNLASLLSTYRDDEASLERAWTIARRLRGAEVPALQDTYGWIAFRRGETEEALTYLEKAAAGLTGDPLVQFHLGMVYAKLDRRDEAIAQFQKAVDIAGPADTRPQIEQARAEITRLQKSASE